MDGLGHRNSAQLSATHEAARYEDEDYENYRNGKELVGRGKQQLG
jgi:hypothetical protein